MFGEEGFLPILTPTAQFQRMRRTEAPNYTAFGLAFLGAICHPIRSISRRERLERLDMGRGVLRMEKKYYICTSAPALENFTGSEGPARGPLASSATGDLRVTALSLFVVNSVSALEGGIYTHRMRKRVRKNMYRTPSARIKSVSLYQKRSGSSGSREQGFDGRENKGILLREAGGEEIIYQAPGVRFASLAVPS
ncbi:hypothetical protein C8R44DRAFT_732023 [Mycena epipterygia]|nr:hypothetical protein C8R44DRAFT_732023 [Mycena epipterygia]